MMLGLPQMQGDELTAAFTSPLVFDLNGPGGGTWTVDRPDPQGPLVVSSGFSSDTVVRSAAHNFIAWATKRRDWRTECIVTGDEGAAAGFLDGLNII